MGEPEISVSTSQGYSDCYLSFSRHGGGCAGWVKAFVGSKGGREVAVKDEGGDDKGEEKGTAKGDEAMNQCSGKPSLQKSFPTFGPINS